MLCPECEKRRIAEGHKTCYPCHIRGIGFTFTGGGMYGRGAFHSATIGERVREARSNPNAEHIG